MCLTVKQGQTNYKANPHDDGALPYSTANFQMPSGNARPTFIILVCSFVLRASEWERKKRPSRESSALDRGGDVTPYGQIIQHEHACLNSGRQQQPPKRTRERAVHRGGLLPGRLSGVQRTPESGSRGPRRAKHIGTPAASVASEQAADRSSGPVPSPATSFEWCSVPAPFVCHFTIVRGEGKGERNSLARGSPVSVRLIYAVLFHTGVRAAGPVKMRRGMSGGEKCPLSVSTVRLNREEDRGQQRMRCRSNDTALTSGESGYIG